MSALVQGALYPAVRPKDIRSSTVPVAPLHEQHRIVEEIEKQFSRLDEAVANLRRVRANLKRYRASVLQSACSGKLVPTEAELARQEGRDYEPADELLKRILVERRRKWEENELARMREKGTEPKDGRWKLRYKDPSPPDTTDLPSLPEGWAVASTDQLASCITSGSRDWSPYYGQGDGTFIMAQNVRMGRLDLSQRQKVNPPEGDSSATRSQVAKGDLLVTIVGAGTGDVCPVPMSLPKHYVCQSIALVRPVHMDLSPYLNVYMTSPENGQRYYARCVYGQGRPHLGFEHLRAAPILLPPLAEQRRIVEEVERRLSSIEQMESVVETSLKRAERLRQSVLKQAFEGRLVPQDPDDEPASVLLERIRAERSSRGNGSKGTKRTRRSGKPVGVQERLPGVG